MYQDAEQKRSAMRRQRLRLGTETRAAQSRQQKLARFFERLPDPSWGSAAIQHPKNDCFALKDSIIDSVGEAARQQAVTPQLDAVNSRIEHQ